ncbi:hypothetical protein TrispH2_001784 [Trichoplax sp. H2]|nr:hypothetical protein TrispH2_001784 [Trichoplax sp. H2]|eukprot:RDD45998.1 hypothetical protein TrispH2_001784 [Trichoplax sp. H2]
MLNVNDGLFSFIFPLLLLIIITVIKVLWKAEKRRINRQHDFKDQQLNSDQIVCESSPKISSTLQEEQQFSIDTECNSTDCQLATNAPMSSSYRLLDEKSNTEERITSTTVEEYADNPIYANKELLRRDYFQKVSPQDEICEQVIIDNQESSCLNWTDLFQNFSDRSIEELNDIEADTMNKIERRGKDSSASTTNSSNRNSNQRSRRVITSSKVVPKHEEVSQGSHTINSNLENRKTRNISRNSGHEYRQQRSISSERNIHSRKKSNAQHEHSSEPIRRQDSDQIDSDGQMKWDRVQQWVEEERRIDQNEWIKEEDWEACDPGKESSECEPDVCDEISCDSRSITSSNNSSVNHRKLLHQLQTTNAAATRHKIPPTVNSENRVGSNFIEKQHKIMTSSSAVVPLSSESNENSAIKSNNVTFVLSRKVSDTDAKVQDESESLTSYSSSSSRNSKIPRRIESVDSNKKASDQPSSGGDMVEKECDYKELRNVISKYFVDSTEMVELGRKIVNFVTAKSKISSYPEFDDVELALNRMCNSEFKDEQRKILSKIGGKDVLKPLLESKNENLRKTTLKAMSIQAINDEDLDTVKVVISHIQQWTKSDVNHSNQDMQMVATSALLNLSTCRTFHSSIISCIPYLLDMVESSVKPMQLHALLVLLIFSWNINNIIHLVEHQTLKRISTWLKIDTDEELLLRIVTLVTSLLEGLRHFLRQVPTPLRTRRARTGNKAVESSESKYRQLRTLLRDILFCTPGLHDSLWELNQHSNRDIHRQATRGRLTLNYLLSLHCSMTVS